MSDYLTIADLSGIHRVLLEKYGGADGLRDRGALEAAAFRPQCGYYADHLEEAAALLESLLINHPFVDGNKRTAFASADVFLRLNGVRLKASPAWLYERLIGWINGAENRREAIGHDLKAMLNGEF